MTNQGDGKVTLLCVIKDRLDFIQKTLPTWLKVRGVSDIVILDWGSSESLQPLIFPCKDRVRLFELDSEEPWKLTTALNVASSFVETEFMLKVDADTLLSESFLESHPMEGSIFYTGNWEIGEVENDHHLNGVFYCKTADFRNIEGYNEYLKVYGWDDSDLYARLEQTLEKRDFVLSELFHLPHGDDLRLAYSDTTYSCAENIQLNRMKAEENPWSGPMTKPVELTEFLRSTKVTL